MNQKELGFVEALYPVLVVAYLVLILEHIGSCGLHYLVAAVGGVPERVELVIGLGPRALALHVRDDTHHEGVPQFVVGDPAAELLRREKVEVGVAHTAVVEDVGDVVNKTVGDRLLPLLTEGRAVVVGLRQGVDARVQRLLAGQGGHLEGWVSERLGHCIAYS